MWPFTRRGPAPSSPPFTSRGVAYLKADLTDVDTGPAIELSYEDSPVLRDLANGLLVAYLVDLGDSFEYVQYRRLARDGIDEDRLHAIGLDNLARKAAAVRVQPYGSIFAVFLDGHFEASLILLDALWDGPFRQFVQGDYAAALPARDILAFCDVASPAGLAELQGVIARLQHSGPDHPITNHLYRRHGTTWWPID